MDRYHANGVAVTRSQGQGAIRQSLAQYLPLAVEGRYRDIVILSSFTSSGLGN